MPLFKGNSPSIIGLNIKEMRNAGHPEAQAVAASLRTAGKGKKLLKKVRKAPHAPKNLGKFLHPPGGAKLAPALAQIPTAAPPGVPGPIPGVDDLG